MKKSGSPKDATKGPETGGCHKFKVEGARPEALPKNHKGGKSGGGRGRRHY